MPTAIRALRSSRDPKLNSTTLDTTKNFKLILASFALLCSALLGLGTAPANAAPDIGGGAPPPCFCLASYEITKSADCGCSLQILELSWLASPNCAQFGNPNCPSVPNKKCKMFAIVEEAGDCGGYWPEVRLSTRCATQTTKQLDCSGGGTHEIKLVCAPCLLI